jgi:hypothetical protein
MTLAATTSTTTASTRLAWRHAFFYENHHVWTAFKTTTKRKPLNNWFTSDSEEGLLPLRAHFAHTEDYITLVFHEVTV